MSLASLLGGPELDHGMESFEEHQARCGPIPTPGPQLIEALARSGCRGRGGAGFPVATKWRAVAGRRRGGAVVLVNGAEGEPLSHKDRRLMETRPHLVLDGAVMAARFVGADDIVVDIGAGHTAAASAMVRALRQRSCDSRLRFRVVRGPARYVAGEETAAVRFVDEGVALPTSIPPRPFVRGIGGRATLVHNVETLAAVALIGRAGDDWYRSLGRGGAAGTTLVTIGGAVRRPDVLEVGCGIPLAEAIASAGGLRHEPQAVLLGGYFGSWAQWPQAADLPLDGAALAGLGHSMGCGVVAVLPSHRCGVVETSRIVAFLANESARQCGPCVFGLRAMADALSRLAARTSAPDDLARLERWAGQLRGRGACHHPDGAAALTGSALRVFADELTRHHVDRACSIGDLAERTWRRSA